MYIAYIDETGCHNGEVFALGGFLLSESESAKLSKAWDEECEKYPQTPNFHAQQFYDVNYGGWRWGDNCTLQLSEKIEIRDRRYAALLDTVLRLQPLGAYVWLRMQEYEKFYKNQVPTDRDSPYFVLFFSLVFGIAKLFDRSERDNAIQFVFDDQKLFRRTVELYYGNAVAEIGSVNERAGRIMRPPPQFRDDNEVTQLKAADLLMWMIQRDLCRRPMCEEFKEKLSRAHGVAKYINQAMLEQVRGFQHADPSAPPAHFGTTARA